MAQRRLLLVGLALALIALLPADVWAQGCAMCKAVAANEPGGTIYGGKQAAGAGLNKGILVMMGAPYVLLFLLFRGKIVSFLKEFREAQG